MINILLIILIVFIGVDIAINAYKIKPKRKVAPDKKAIEKARQKRREFENFMSYSGDEQH